MKNIEYFCYLVFELEQKYDIITEYNLKIIVAHIGVIHILLGYYLFEIFLAIVNFK